MQYLLYPAKDKQFAFVFACAFLNVPFCFALLH